MMAAADLNTSCSRLKSQTWPERPGSATRPPITRLPALDGLRGVLAAGVVANHVLLLGFGSGALNGFGRFCVLAFFAISAHVLTRSWGRDGFPVFLLKRVIRLWPVYAFCIVAGGALQGIRFDPAVLAWMSLRVRPDEPAWSLVIEAWAALAMPVIAWSGRDSPWRTLGLSVLWFALCGASACFTFGAAFLIGARLSIFEPRWRLLQGAVPQWLGKISYSLYLTHWPILAVMPAWLALPILPLAGWLTWRWLERPSIEWSRTAGRMLGSGLASRPPRPA